MREIKFRAYRKDAKESGIVIGYSNDIDGEHIYIRFFTRDGKWQYEQWYKIDDESIVIMQYTGLKDKNGKEIYEGDIIKCDGYIGAIEYREDVAGYGIADKDKKSIILFLDIFLNKCITEVIGNIYENPELLHD